MKTINQDMIENLIVNISIIDGYLNSGENQNNNKKKMVWYSTAFCVCLCFVVHYFVSFLVLQPS